MIKLNSRRQKAEGRRRESRTSNIEYPIFYLLFFAFLFSSCETPISLNIPGKEDTKVIEGWIENDKPAIVVVSQSLSYYSSVGVESILASVDTAAIVKISDDMGNTEQLQRQHTMEHAFTFFLLASISPNPSALVDSSIFMKLLTLTPYAYVGKTIKGIPGHTYTLYVESKGEVYTAKTTIPLNTVQVDSLALFKRSSDTSATLRVFLTDRAETYDCYRFFLKIEHLDWHYEQVFIGTFDDLTFNGLSASYELMRRPQGNIYIPGMSQEMREEYNRSTFRKGDVIHVKSTLTDKATADYWFPLQTDIALGDNPFMTPGTYPTNIKGENVTGIWSGYNARYDTIRFDASAVLR